METTTGIYPSLNLEMKKIIRYIIYTLLVIAGIFAMAALLFPFFFSPERIKTALLDELQSRLQRPIQMESAKVSFFPHPRLVARNLRVEDREGFSPTPFLSAPYLKIRIKLLPLLGKRVVIDDFLLEHPQLKLEKNAQGNWNWESWAPPKPASQEEKESSGGRSSLEARPERTGVSPLIVGILSSRVKQGEIQLRDETRKSPQVLSLQQVNIDSSGQWRGKEGNFKFKAQARVQEAMLQVKGELVVARGQRQPDLNLDFDLKNLKISELKEILYYFSWPPYLAAQGTLSGQGQARWRTGKWEYQAQAKLAGGEATWERPEGKLKLWGDGSFNLTGTKKEGPKVTAFLSLQEGLWSYPWEGKKEGRLQWTNLRGKVEYLHHRLEVNAIEFDFYGGKGKGKFWWDDSPGRGKMNLEMEAEGVKLEDLTSSAFPPKSPVEGVLSLTFKAQGEGNHWRDFRRTAAGNGEIAVSGFEIKGVDTKDPLAEFFFALIGGSPQQENKNGPMLKGKFLVSEGRVLCDDLILSAPWYSAEARGSYDLVDSTLNLKGQAKSGGQKIDFQAKGPLSKLHWNFKMGQVDLKFDMGKPKKKKKK